MRIAAYAILTIMSVGMAAPARAQTYDPDWPICMQVFGKEVDYFDCTFTSLPQCKATASGRNAMCVINPYYAPRGGAERNVRQQRRAN
jgi:hypothetical protein